MRDIQKPEDIHGLWAAIPTPWDDRGKFDAAVLQRNVERLTQTEIAGIYTTDSDGEFYSIELEDFKQLAAAFARAMESTGLAVAMGATWCNTSGIIDRMKVALDHGIRAFHIAFPFWMPLNASDRQHFWDDLARAVPEARWIHYNTPRGHKVLSGADYAVLARDYPQQLIGSKIGSLSLLEVVEIVHGAPNLAHLTVDYLAVPGTMMGAAGVCSYWVNTLPRWTCRMLQLAANGDAREAMRMQQKLLWWEASYTKPLRDAGYLHGIIGKARGALSEFLEDSGYCRPPYYRVDDQLMSQFKREFESYWSEEITTEQFT